MKRKFFKIFLVIVVFSWLFLVNNNCYAIEQNIFDGSIDFINKSINFNFDLKEGGTAEVNGSIIDDEEYSIDASLRHLKFGKTDIQTDFKTQGVITDSGDGRTKVLKGEAFTRHTLLNFKPFKDLNVRYEIKKDKLVILHAKWAELSLKGEITLRPSWALDLVVTIDKMDLRSLIKLLGVDDRDLALGGIVSGELQFRGPLEAVKVQGKLLASEGRVKSIKFTSIRANLGGKWPILRFENAQINAKNGIVYGLGGEFNAANLSDLDSADHKVMVHYANNAMRFQDWVIKRKADDKGFDIVEAEYDLEKNQALKMRIKDKEETLELQKSIKF